MIMPGLLSDTDFAKNVAPNGKWILIQLHRKKNSDFSLLSKAVERG